MFERLAVLGAGAIGGIIGGYLARDGRDVTLIDGWAAHVDTINADGLRITALDEEFTVPVKAIHLSEVCNVSEPFDTVFLCVKSYDTVWNVHLVLPHLSPDGVVVSAQNAMNDELIAPIVGFARSIGCVVTLGAGLAGPGQVVRTSRPERVSFTVGELSGQTTRRADTLAEVLTPAGLTRVTTNLWGVRWAKLATNCMANAISALTGLSSSELRQTSGVAEISIRIAQEVVNVGAALGLQVEAVNGIPAEAYEGASDPGAMEEIKTRLLESARELGAGRPSMLQDVLKGRRTEIEFLNGYVATRGKELGVPAPLNETITGLVKRIERGELKPHVSNIKLMEEHP